MQYKPRPFPTENIELPKDLMDLAEQLSKNTHEVWAQRRLWDGWTYGPARDDNARKHPGLVPYEELSDREKAYDRDTALETLKLIVALGFKIGRE